MTDPELLDKMVQDLGEHTPGFEVRYKDESKLMKVLGFLLSPINPFFMTMFVTTWGKAVYYPSRAFTQRYALPSVAVLAHEFVHVWDSQTQGALKFKHAYIAPQVYGLATLALFAVYSPWPVVLLLSGYLVCCLVATQTREISPLPSGISAGVLGLLVFGLAFLTSGVWGPLLLLGALAPFAPWPSKGRTHIELRGYMMSIMVHRWLYGEDMADHVKDKLVGYFTGPDYYFMTWSSDHVREALSRAGEEAGGPVGEPFEIVRKSLRANGRLHERYA